MARRTERFTLTQFAEELLRRLDAEMSASGSRNIALARIKASDVLTYIRRYEDARNPERLNDGEVTH